MTMITTKPSNDVVNGVREWKLKNIPLSVPCPETVPLVDSRNEIRHCKEIEDENGNRTELSKSYLQSTNRKPLNASGYISSSTSSIIKTPSQTQCYQASSHEIGTDNRRNLYVLGISFDLNKTEFAELFSKYGTVSHCVILATVDSSSRRRGFVVMSTHEEAKAAIKSLSRKQINGHTLDISWAVVQRSQGFLDGGDRTVILDSRAPSGFSESAKLHCPPFIHANASIEFKNGDPVSLVPTYEPTSTLLVRNLPTFLFSQVRDLYPLFCPFGQIIRLEILPLPPTALRAGHILVVVEYSSIFCAQTAIAALQGQSYAGSFVSANYLQVNTPLALASYDATLQHIIPDDNPNGPSFSPPFTLVPHPLLPPFVYPNDSHHNTGMLGDSNPSRFLTEYNAEPRRPYFPMKPFSYNHSSPRKMSRPNFSSNFNYGQDVYSTIAAVDPSISYTCFE